MAECWHHYYSPENNSEKFKGLSMAEKLESLQRQMKNLVGQIYEQIFNNNKSFHIDEVYPTRPSQLSALEFLHQEKQFKEAVLDFMIKYSDTDAAWAKKAKDAVDEN